HEDTKRHEDTKNFLYKKFFFVIFVFLRAFVVSSVIRRATPTSYKNLPRESRARVPFPDRRTLRRCESAPTCGPRQCSRTRRAGTCSSGNSGPARRSRRSRSGTI